MKKIIIFIIVSMFVVGLVRINVNAEDKKSIIELVKEIKATKDKKVKQKLGLEIGRKIPTTKEEVKSLLELLRDDDLMSNDSVRYAIQQKSLGSVRQEDKHLEPLFLEAISDSSPYVKLAGIVGCGKLKSSRAVPDLIKIVKEKKLKSPIWLYCYTSSMLALGEIGDTKAIPVLIKVAKDQKDFATHYGIPEEALKKMGRSVLPYMVEWGNSISERKDKMNIELNIGTIIVGIEDKSAIPDLFAILNNPQNKDFLRGDAASAIGRLGDKTDIDRLFDMYSSEKSEKNRILILRGLTYAKDKTDIDRLFNMYSSEKSKDGKWIIIGGLIRAKDKRVIFILTEEFKKEPDYLTREQIIGSLEEIGTPEIIPILKEISETDKNRQVRERAIWSLKKLTGKHLE